MLLQHRRERFIVLMIFKLFHDLVPSNLNIQFRDKGQTGIKVVLPSYLRGCSSAVAMHLLPMWAPNCGTCCRHLRTICELDEFKRKFTGFFLLLPDRPSIPDYSIANHNSLVEVVPIHRNSVLERLLRGVTGPPPAGCARSEGVR